MSYPFQAPEPHLQPSIRARTIGAPNSMGRSHMAAIRRFDRYTELGPYTAWVSRPDDGEYTIAVQVSNHLLTSDDDESFETEDQALAAADGLAHRLQH